MRGEYESSDGILLNINLTKDSSLLLDAIHSLARRSFKENQTLLWFLKMHKKIRETKKLVSFREKYCIERKKRVKRVKLESEKTRA